MGPVARTGGSNRMVEPGAGQRRRESIHMGAARSHPQPHRGMDRRGFTLAEALLASTILAIVSASAALPFAAGVQQAQEAARLTQAVALGQAMMEEVLARTFLDPDFSPSDSRAYTPGPELDELSRDQFDNIDDFHGYSESGIGLRRYTNEVITDPDCAGFWRDVQVSYVSYAGQQTSDTNSFVNIRVRVWDGTAVAVTLNRIATREN